MGSRQQHTDKPPGKQPPKVVNPTSSSPFNAGTSHISMAITTSKNQIFIIVCHLPLHSEKKRGSLALTANKRLPTQPTCKVFSLANRKEHTLAYGLSHVRKLIWR